MEIGTVRQIDIEHEMQSVYLGYAMSAIVSRALPDVEDGLRLEHRRILYDVCDAGLRSDRPCRKSARIEGEVLGKYHPHGDATVHQAVAHELIRLWMVRRYCQSWSPEPLHKL